MQDKVNQKLTPEEMEAINERRILFIKEALPKVELELKYYDIQAKISEAIYKDIEFRHRLAQLEASQKPTQNGNQSTESIKT